jgi:hypothetical protein
MSIWLAPEQVMAEFVLLFWIWESYDPTSFFEVSRELVAVFV